MAAHLVAHLRMIDPAWTESEHTALRRSGSESQVVLIDGVPVE